MSSQCGRQRNSGVRRTATWRETRPSDRQKVTTLTRARPKYWYGPLEAASRCQCDERLYSLFRLLEQKVETSQWGPIYIIALQTRAGRLVAVTSRPSPQKSTVLCCFCSGLACPTVFALSIDVSELLCRPRAFLPSPLPPFHTHATTVTNFTSTTTSPHPVTAPQPPAQASCGVGLLVNPSSIVFRLSPGLKRCHLLDQLDQLR